MIKEIGQRIAEIRGRQNLTQENLAELARLSRISIARYESGKIEPGANALNRIADALGVTTDELLGRKDRLSPFIDILHSAVPIAGDIACGAPLWAEENIEGYTDLPSGVHADFALRCKGDSMIPTFNDGDLVLIRKQEEVENGQIAAVMIENEATLKRFYAHDEEILLIADNPKYPPIVITQNYISSIYVCGLAVGYVHMFNGKGGKK